MHAYVHIAHGDAHYVSYLQLHPKQRPLLNFFVTALTTDHIRRWQCIQPGVHKRHEALKLCGTYGLLIQLVQNQKIQSYTTKEGIASFAREFRETGATDTDWLLGGGQRNRVRGTGLAEDVTEETTE